MSGDISGVIPQLRNPSGFVAEYDEKGPHPEEGKFDEDELEDNFTAYDV